MASHAFVCYFVTYVCNFNKHPSGVKKIYIFTSEFSFEELQLTVLYIMEVRGSNLQLEIH